MSPLEADTATTTDPTPGVSTMPAGPQPPLASAPELFKEAVVVALVLLTVVVLLGVLVVIAPSAGAAGGCGGG
jgi:hypothetical protein